LLCIINHFNNFPFKTKKYLDFLLFKKAYNIINNKEHLTYLQKLVNIRASLNKGLSEKLAIAFSNTIPEAEPVFDQKQDNNISNTKH
jgi:LAGLIDADG endonuclease